MLKPLLILFIIFIYGDCFAAPVIPAITIATHSKLDNFQTGTSSARVSKVITTQQIKQSGADNLQQLLMGQGVEVRDLEGDGSETVVNMRGFGGNAGTNTLVLLNGHPLSNPDLAIANINQIPLVNVQKIEITSGSEGVMYGDQAVAGVINIITKNYAKTIKQFKLGYGSYNSQNYQAQFAGKKRGLGFRVSALINRSNNYRQHNKTSGVASSVFLRHNFGKVKTTLNYFYNYSYLQYPGALTANQLDKNRRQSRSSTNKDFYDMHNHILLLDFDRSFSANWHLQCNNELRFMQGHGVLTYNYHNNRYAINITPQLHGIINFANSSVIATFGAKYSFAHYNFTGFNYLTNAQQAIAASFAQFNMPLNNRLTLLGGIRAAVADSKLTANISSQDQSYPAINHAVIANLGLQYQFTNDLKIFIRRAGSYRFPKTDENVSTNTGRPLKTQTGVSYEGVLLWEEQNLTAYFELYQLQLYHEISAVPIPNSQTTYMENENLPRTMRRGFSFQGDYQVNRYLRLSTIYHYVHARFSSGFNSGNRIPFVPTNQLSLSAVLTPRKSLNFSLEALYAGARSYANDPEQRSRLLPGYTIYNLAMNLTYRFLRFNLRVNNITNKYYNAYAFDVYSGKDTYSYYYPAAGINFMATMAVNL